MNETSIGGEERSNPKDAHEHKGIPILETLEVATYRKDAVASSGTTEKPNK